MAGTDLNEEAHDVGGTGHQEGAGAADERRQQLQRRAVHVRHQRGQRQPLDVGLQKKTKKNRKTKDMKYGSVARWSI